MAARLTDRQKKKIVADYVQLGSYNATAKLNGVSDKTVRNIVLKNPDISEKYEQKKEENTADILDYMERQRDDVCKVLGICLNELKKTERYERTPLQQIATTMAILIDKYTASGGGPKDEAAAKSALACDIPASLIARDFVDVHRDIWSGAHREYVEKGGRGSTKSSFISLEIAALLRANPTMHAVCCRKVGNTLRDSVFAQMEWAVDTLGWMREFEIHRSRLEITYKPTGQKIFFRGADDPIKLKSIKPPFGYIGILWLEELDQFSEDECRSIQQSVIRGGDDAYIFKSFNPPKTKKNWANQYVERAKDTMLVTHSDYRGVPRQWLGRAFIDEAEHLKEINPDAYDHEYLGIANGNGGMVFTTVEIRAISDAEIARFDWIYNGIDFGWFPDPLAFVRLHYDAARETIYLFGEIVGNKIPNADAAERILAAGYNDADTVCDSAEPKSVYDLRDYGIKAMLAEKGPGSVEYSMKWLQRRKIIIDPVRCPNAAREFSEYEYERDKNGGVISRYPDKNNHCIDAVRYALERIWRKRGYDA